MTKTQAVEKTKTKEVTFKVKGYKILQANLKDGKLEVAYIKEFDGILPHEIVESCKNEVHDDLKDAFERLKPHYVCINDYKEAQHLQIKDYQNPALAEIKVTGFHIKGDGQSVILIGQKKIKNRVLCANTPNLKFEDKAYPYEHTEHLTEVLDRISNEIIAYLNGKMGPVRQQAMELEETGDDE